MATKSTMDNQHSEAVGKPMSWTDTAARKEELTKLIENNPSLKNYIEFKGWMDRSIKMVGSAAAAGYVAREGYDRYMQARNARTARQRVNRINRNPSSRSGRRDL